MGLLVRVLAVAAAGVVYQQISSAIFRRRFVLPGTMLNVGGHRVHATCTGAGRPCVVLESGIAASSVSWTVVQPEIARFTRVCSYDRAGLGWSDRPSQTRTFGRIVNELWTLVRQMDDGLPCVLVGHSFGSFVARAVAASHPADVAGVVMVDPPTEWLTLTEHRIHLLRGGRHLARVGAWLARLGVVRLCLALLTGGAPGAPRTFVKIFGPTAARTLERLVGEVRKLPVQAHPIVQAMWCQPKCFAAMADHFAVLERDGAEIAAAVPAPAVPLVVISSRDQSEDQIAGQRRLADASANGRHLVATRGGHWIHFDEPELIVSVVREIVDAWRGGRSAPGSPSLGGSD